MSNTTSRRNFVKKAGLLAIGATSAFLNEELNAMSVNPVKKTRRADLFKLGMAGYTFLHFNIDSVLETMQKVDVSYLCIKDFHLPLTATQAECDAFQSKLRSHGVIGYAVGPISMRTEAQVDQAFQHARLCRVNLVVGVPSHELLPYIDRKVKEYDFKYAIHIHGPDSPLFPNAKNVFDNVRHLDPRIGICLDIGHNVRDGHDPVTDLRKYQKRVFDVHIKDVTAPAREGTHCEIGRGVVNIPAFVKMLRKVKYDGVCSLEHEKDMREPLAGIAESIGYFKGVMDAV